MNNLAILVHLSSCFFMTGLIWLIQLIHYPSFKFINPMQFTEFHRFHTNTITFIVGPVMTIELFSGVYLLFQQKSNPIVTINIIGLILIWATTAFMSVPNHTKLSLGFNETTASYLVLTNWIRTTIWSLRSLGLLYWLWELMRQNEFKF